MQLRLQPPYISFFIIQIWKKVSVWGLYTELFYATMLVFPAFAVLLYLHLVIMFFIYCIIYIVTPCVWCFVHYGLNTMD